MIITGEIVVPPSGPGPHGLPPALAAALQSGRLADAEQIATSILAMTPGDALILNTLGGLRIARGSASGARRPLVQSTAIAPQAAAPALNLALTFLANGDAERARRWSIRARLLDPGLADAHATEASAERACAELGRAERALRRAIALSPSVAEFLANAGNLHLDREIFDAGACFFRRALAVAPHAGNPRFQLGCLALFEGRLASGWADYEARFSPPSMAKRRPFPYPEWQGQPLGPNSLLVWGEQGLGDEIVFGTLLKDTLDRAPAALFECDPRLVSIFTRSFPGLRAYPRRDPPDPALLSPAISHQIALGSLPRLFRPSTESFAGKQATLLPDPPRLRASGEWLASLGGGLKVGIAWRSSRKDAATRRMHTTLAEWGPLLTAPGITLVNLQYDECGEEIASAEQQFGVRIHQPPGLDLFRDLEGVLALSASLDLAIATGTTALVFPAVAGVETWVLRYAADYLAFGLDRYLWYPQTHCFVRPPGAGWSETIAAAANALRDRVRIGVLHHKQ
jgi:tetratricopeptide (TPR) repeat protein